MKNDIKKNRRKAFGLWKKMLVCSVLFVLMMSSVQAVNYEQEPYEIKSYELEADENYGLVTEDPQDVPIDYRWVCSWEELLYTLLNGQPQWVGILAVMKVPTVIETGRLYSIPVYYIRFTGDLLKYLDFLPFGDEDTDSDNIAIPIDVFMFAGIGTRSSSDYTVNHDEFFHLGVGIGESALWTHDIPIRITPIFKEEDNPQIPACGFSQKIWIQQPEYHYLHDIPIWRFDGPYWIRVQLDPIYHLPYEKTPLEQENKSPVNTPEDYRKELVEIITSQNYGNTNAISKSQNGNLITSKKYEGIPFNTGTTDTPLLSLIKEKTKFKSVKSMECKEINGKSIYQIKGVKTAKLLWCLPVEMSVTVNLDLDAGTLEKVETPWWAFLTG